ncbi:S8 family serine peptidase [Streptomyces sp. KE1]|uniref:S8 family peptidase n=1 Tax=Streptomyces sp. KE1 TaxID=1638939 RepID=UPI00063EC7A5|nr:S8 family serine peptidase [Streptomyces sp. KE1]KLI97285.1 peptidase S8 [Streptomyces sp. KE1]
MTASSARARRAFALPMGLAVASSLVLVPVTTASAAEAAPVATTATTTAAGGEQISYVVNILPGKLAAALAERAITKAGGTVVKAYDKIGVVVVHSARADFAEKIRKVPGVQSAGATRTTPLAAQSTDDMGAPVELSEKQLDAASAKAEGDEDPLQGLQWDLPAIKADKAHQKSLGSSKVTVAVIDTGVDDTHPDLAPNFDREASVNCVGGVPDTTDGAWRPQPGESAHGTHVAGEIAAAKNGIGMTGVAPGVKVSGIKVSQPDGFFYTEAVVCGFMWAAEHGVDVTNNSYYTDPWMFNCTDDPDQKALVHAVGRATAYAELKGAVNVASAGNSKLDLAADTLPDASSPNDSTPVDREIDPSTCLDIPAQLPGVVTVSATGAKNLKSSYSNYGKGVIDITAPGGDSTVRQAPEAPAVDGRILGTLPGGGYGYMMGTSMAGPHVAGVAALIKSTHPKAPAFQVKALLKAQADTLACPEPYDLDGDGVNDAVCEGGKSGAGFYGAGMADALDAVTKR